MPEIVVYAVGNRPAEQKAALCKDITDAMVKNYKVPPEAVVITLVETTLILWRPNIVRCRS